MAPADLPTPADVVESRWTPVTTVALAMFLAGVAGLALLIQYSPMGFVPGVDHANLVIHEAGHTLFGLFSHRLEIYGGTAGQLLAPAIMTVFFARKGDSIGTAGCVTWLCENLFNVSRYVADARTMALPLVGGDQHDWNTILGRWGGLAHDATIAWWCNALGAVGILAVMGTLVWRWYHDRGRASSFPLAWER